MRLSQKHLTLIALAVLIALAPAFFPSNFYYRIGALIFVNGLAVTGLVVLIGFAGQISLGHAGFAGIGAYACALAPGYLGLHPGLAMLLGALLSGGIAWLIGRPILRLKGYYLAVATLGFGILVSMVLANEAKITGGPDGREVAELGLRSVLAAIGIGLSNAQFWYAATGLSMLAGAWIALNLQGSPSRMKIITSIMIRPRMRFSYCCSTVSACGSRVSVAAPRMAPGTDPRPPNTVIVTSSTECRKPATSGVMKRFISASSEPDSEA